MIARDTGLMLPSWVTDNVDAASRIDNAMQSITHAYYAGRLILMVGAGASLPAGLPTGSDLVRQAIAERMFPLGVVPDPTLLEPLLATPFEVVMAALAEALGDGTAGLEQWLRERLQASQSDAEKAYHELSQLLNAPGLGMRRIFTTNFDTLIERVIGGRAKTVTRSNIHDLDAIERSASNDLAVVHFHGAILPHPGTHHDGTLIATEAQLFNSLHELDVMRWRLIESMLNADAFVFVGYGLADANIRAIYHQFRAILEQKKLARRTYLVSPTNDAVHYTFASRVATTRSAALIPTTAAAFFGALTRRLEVHSERIAAGLIAEHLGHSPTEYEAVERIVGEVFSFDQSTVHRMLQAAPNRHGSFLGQGGHGDK